MALVVLPEGQQRSGKQGGMVWSHNAGGPYVRNRAIPTNPNTARQVAVRNAVRALTIAWNNTLTPAQRAAWDVYGANVSWTNRLGQTITLTGLNHYVRTNTPLLVSKETRIDAAPVLFNIGAAELALAAAGSEATQQITVTFDDTAAWANEVGGFQFLYMGLPQNASRNYFSSPYRLLGYITGDLIAPPASPLPFTAPYPFAAGQRIWLRTRVIRADGRLSEFAEVNFLGAA